jgi:hypothetical protein
MRVIVIIFSILAFIICMLFGLQLSRGKTFNSPITPSETPITQTATIGNPDQRNILIIQADDLTSSSPRLIAIWLLIYIPDDPQTSLILIYPQASGKNTDIQQRLVNTFALPPQGGLDPAFISALQSFSFTTTAYIILDIQAGAQAIDWLGGLELAGNSEALNGNQSLSDMPLPWLAPDAAREWNKKLANAICERVKQKSSDTNPVSMMASLIPDHLRTDLTLEMVAQDWHSQTHGEEPIACKISLP